MNGSCRMPITYGVEPVYGWTSDVSRYPWQIDNPSNKKATFAFDILCGGTTRQCVRSGRHGDGETSSEPSGV